jgi:diketogulonate reductase-like aldo/keto reductase
MTSTSNPDEPRRILSDGGSIPVLGLGVWQIAEGSECVNAVRWALDEGYRHIDTAQAYENEESVGRGFRESGMSRDEVFITTKFNPLRKDPVVEVEASLRRLELEFVDLYLVHWPQRGATWMWPAMERVQELGYARSIGVSNYSIRELDEVLANASIAPVVNQVQFSPYQYRRRLLEGCDARGIALEAYSSLGTGKYLDRAVVTRVAERCGRTPAQVLLRWCLQHDALIIPKSRNRDRISENSQVFDFSLSADDMAQLDGLDETGQTDGA